MPPALSVADLRADIRYLAKIDTRHRFLRPKAEGGVTDGWFDRAKLTILTERAVDGTPLVGVMLKYPALCPADETADMRIKFWLANLDRKDDLPAAFKASIQAIHDEMVRVGATRVWGRVPDNASHLITLLDPIATAGKCTKTDGVLVEGNEDYKGGSFYFGERTKVNTEVQAG